MAKLSSTEIFGNLKVNGEIIANDDSFLKGSNTEFGTSATSGVLKIWGSTAGTSSKIFTTTGNLHIDCNAGASAIYLNYYTGTGGIKFGNGAGASLANVSSAGVFTGAGFVGSLTGNAATATWADTVDVNPSNSGTGEYEIVWASGDVVYSTDGITINRDNKSITAGRLISTVATGTSPLTVTSTTVVAHLNADYVDGIQGSSLLKSDADDNLTAAIVVPTANRDEGIFGTYDPAKTQHIWSMGTSFRNAADGSSFGTLYGLAYKYNGSAGSHGTYHVINGAATCGMGTNLWTSGIVQGRATSANYADLAEKYTFANDVEFAEGKVVIISHEDDYDCEISNESCSQSVLGVMSLKPGFMMNYEGDGEFVALKGRVPAWVQGPVKKGEPLVSYFNGSAIGINNPEIQSTNQGIIFGKSLTKIEDNSLQKVEIVVL